MAMVRSIAMPMPQQMTDIHRQCPNCSVALHLGLRSISAAENLCQEVSVCVRCEYRELGAVVEGTIHIEPEFSLIIEWRSGTPTMAEIRAIRKLDYNLEYISLPIVIATLKAKPYWIIQNLPLGKLYRLIEVAKNLNLKYRIE
jgi:hypothetical protein